MAKLDLTLDNFERFLSVLDPDRERAWSKYAQIRDRLVRFFVSKRRSSAEDLTDEVISRVALKIQTVEELDNVNAYIYAIARNLLKEYSRQTSYQDEEPQPMAVSESDNDRESVHQCLEKCIARLPSEAQDLILRYYEGSGPSKLDYKRALAEELGLSQASLRVRAHRIRVALHKCVTECLEKDRPNTQERLTSERDRGL